MDALAKLVNEGLKCGADVLNQMLEAEIKMEMPSVQVLKPVGLDGELGLQPRDASLAVVEMGFGGCLKGNSGLIFEEENAWKFVEKIAGDDAGSDGFDFISAGVLTEIGNIVLNRVMGAISNALSLNLDYVVPNFYQGDLEQLWRDTDADTSKVTGLLAKTRFEIEDMATDGNIVVFFDGQSYETLVSMIEGIEDIQ